MNRKLTWSKEWHENLRLEVAMAEHKATVCALGAARVIGVLFGQIVTIAAATNCLCWQGHERRHLDEVWYLKLLGR